MKIDFTKIDGYDNMTPEEKVQAIENFEFNLIDKKIFDNKASETARYSKEVRALKEQLNSRLSEEEKKQAEKEQEITQLRESYENLLKENKISKAKTEYLSMGMDNELAEATAKAFVNGDETTIFENQRKFIELREKEIKAEMLNNQTVLTNGKPLTDEEKEKQELRQIRGYFGL